MSLRIDDLDKVVVDFQFYSARQALDELINIFGADVVWQYASRKLKCHCSECTGIESIEVYYPEE